MKTFHADFSLYRQAFQAADSGLVLLNREGTVMHCNDAFAGIMQHRPPALEERVFLDFCAEEDRETLRDHLEILLSSEGEPFGLEIRLCNETNRNVWVYLAARLLEPENQEPVIILTVHDASTYHDVQDSLEQNLRQIRRSEKNLADILDVIPHALFVVDNRGRILLCNKGSQLLFSAPQEKTLGQNLETFFPGDMPAILTYLNKTSSSRHGKHFDTFQIHTQAAHPTAQPIPVSLQLRPMGWGNSHESLCIVEDLSEREDLERRIDEATYFDTLTGLPNRQYLHRHMTYFLAEPCDDGNQKAVFFCDLDRFKFLNDSFGHALSDHILSQVGQRILTALFPNDLVCRYSGDKFIIVPEQCLSAETSAKIAQKILTAIADPIHIDGQELFLTASIGIAVSPGDGSCLDTLVKNAESAMYRVKKRGGNAFSFYTRKLNAHSMDRLKLVNALYRALERKEFFLSFQPQVDPHSYTIMGAEALLRWNYPKRGILMPNDFIPLLEETGLIVPVGTWVLEKACAQAMRWRKLIHPKFRIAVNISARQLRDREFISRLQSSLKTTGLPADGLELEITESALLDDMDASAKVLGAVADMGVHITIDDFGTGYSSFKYLKHFSVHALKLDRLFVEGLPHKMEDISISRAICTLAKSLNLNLVAEGVENSRQLALLKKWHCTHIQGFFFTQPLAAGPFEHWISANAFALNPAERF